MIYQHIGTKMSAMYGNCQLAILSVKWRLFTYKLDLKLVHFDCKEFVLYLFNTTLEKLLYADVDYWQFLKASLK